MPPLFVLGGLFCETIVGTFMSKFLLSIIMLSILPSVYGQSSTPDDVLAKTLPQAFDRQPPAQISLAVDAISSINDLFNVIAFANRQHEFDSLLTYEANGHIYSFELSQMHEGDRVFQELVFMNGPNRRIIRQQGLSLCEQGGTRWGLWPEISETVDVAEFNKLYQLKRRKTERIANRDTVVYELYPKDEFRHGYLYNIDSQTGLVLKYITTYKGKIIERLQVGSFRLKEVDEIDEGRERHSKLYALRVPEIDPCYSEHFKTQWNVNWLPKGFSHVGNRVTAQGEHVLMFSDGLASVSIFITDERLKHLAKVTARHGAMVVVVAPADNAKYYVAVVGEVPDITARRIAVSVTNGQ